MAEDNVIYLEKDAVYFDATFLDDEFEIPCIDTYIFLGMLDGEFLFKDAHEKSRRVVIAPEDMTSFYDRVALSKWLLEEHSPRCPKKTVYTYRFKDR